MTPKTRTITRVTKLGLGITGGAGALGSGDVTTFSPPSSVTGSSVPLEDGVGAGGADAGSLDSVGAGCGEGAGTGTEAVNDTGATALLPEASVAFTVQE